MYLSSHLLSSAWCEKTKKTKLVFSALSEFSAVYLNSLLELTVMNFAQGLLLDLKLEALFLFTYLVKNQNILLLAVLLLLKRNRSHICGDENACSGILKPIVSSFEYATWIGFSQTASYRPRLTIFLICK